MSRATARNGLNLASSVFWMLLMLAAVPALAGTNSGAAFSTWPDTGQTKCYNDTVEIPCPAPGEPFYGQDAQYNGPARSYTVLGGGTMVQDNVTGLIWEMKDSTDETPDYGNSHDADNWYSWCDPNPDTNGGYEGICVEFETSGYLDTKDFIDQVNSENFGGYSDWRLPTIKELATLANFQKELPSVDPVISTTAPYYYWSATAHSTNSQWAWLAGFDIGITLEADKGYGPGIAVRAVRGGNPPLINNYVDNNDGTIIDLTTCLQWQKDALDDNDDDIANAMNWQQALSAAERLNLAGYTDWRLPNINELRSIVDYSRSEPALNPIFSDPSSNGAYWSSTTYIGNAATDFAWRVGILYGGYGDGGSKTSSFYARAVRGQQCGNFGTWTPSAPMGRIYHTPRFGPPGTTFTESGTGFTPNSTVTLHFRNQFGEEQTPIPKPTDAQGAFEPIFYHSLSDKPLGTHTWWVVDDTTRRMSETIGYQITGPPGTQVEVGNGGTTVLPPIRINSDYGILTSEGEVDTSKETFVIVHGWNLPWNKNDLPDWMRNPKWQTDTDEKMGMGQAIKLKGANVLYWNWQEKAQTKVTSKLWNGKNDQSCIDIVLPVGLIYPPAKISDYSLPSNFSISC